MGEEEELRDHLPRPQIAPPKRKEKRMGFYAAIVLSILAAILFFSNSLAYKNLTVLQADYGILKSNYDVLQSSYNTLRSNYDALRSNYDKQSWEYYLLVGKYNDLVDKYTNLKKEYDVALKTPYTTIKEGNVTWAFKTMDGNLMLWQMPLETYVYYATQQKPVKYHSLSYSGTGQLFKVRNCELFVQPEFFSKVIQGLTEGKSARDFVQEVFNLRKQLTVYSRDITDTPQWSAETMTKGAGDCEDFAILMGSLLVAGNRYAKYGMTIQMVYMDADNPTNPKTVNHVLLYVTYQDQTAQFVDSTSTTVLSPWSEVVGWYFELS